MQLRLFRVRRWWPVERKAGLAGTDPAAPRPRGAPGHHRKTRQTVPARSDQAAGRATAPLQTNLEDVIATRQYATPSGGADAAAGSSGSVSPRDGSPGRATGRYARPPGMAAARVAIRAAPATTAPDVTATLQASGEPALPWYEPEQDARAAGTVRHCGPLENVLVRDWAPGREPPAESVTAISRLADLPQLVKQKLAAGLDAIHVGPGGVPDLDHMARLKGVPLPSGRATWDACAGAYGNRKIIVGSRPSPTPDVMCHEVGHALDDIDGTGGRWQSDAPEFHGLYGRCLPYLASEFHWHGGPLARREFFADSFAAIASRQRPALVQMLSGNTRAALDVMLYFNVRYGM